MSSERWYRKPGGSVHAFQAPGLYSLCKRFNWQATWQVADPAASDQDREDECSVCRQMLTPPSRMPEDLLVRAYGGLPID